MQYSRYRLTIGGLVLGLNFAVGMNFFSVSPVLSLLMEDYGIGRGTAGLLVGVVTLMQAALSIAGGAAAVRLGLRRVFMTGALLASAMVLSPLAESFLALLALRAVFGVGIAVMLPATGVLLVQWFPRNELPLMNGLMLVCVSLGVALSVLFTAPLADVLGWQGALAVPGATVLGAAVLWAILGRTRRADSQEAPPLVSLRQMWSTLRNKTTLLLILADVGPFAQYVALTAWLPTFYYEVLGMPLNRAGFMVGLLPVVGMFAVVLGGLLPMKVNRRRPFFIVPGLLVGFAGFGSFLTGEGPLLYVSLIGLGFASWFYLPTLLTMPMELPGMTEDRVVMAWAALMTVGGFATFLSPLAVGAMTDALGSYAPGFSVWAFLSWSLLVAAIFLPETGVRAGKGRGVVQGAEEAPTDG